jgi:hypothetical protein
MLTCNPNTLLEHVLLLNIKAGKNDVLLSYFLTQYCLLEGHAHLKC